MGNFSKKSSPTVRNQQFWKKFQEISDRAVTVFRKFARICLFNLSSCSEIHENVYLQLTRVRSCLMFAYQFNSSKNAEDGRYAVVRGCSHIVFVNVSIVL